MAHTVRVVKPSLYLIRQQTAHSSALTSNGSSTSAPALTPSLPRLSIQQQVDQHRMLNELQQHRPSAALALEILMRKALEDFHASASAILANS